MSHAQRVLLWSERDEESLEREFLIGKTNRLTGDEAEPRFPRLKGGSGGPSGGWALLASWTLTLGGSGVLLYWFIYEIAALRTERESLSLIGTGAVGLTVLTALLGLIGAIAYKVNSARTSLLYWVHWLTVFAVPVMVAFCLYLWVSWPAKVTIKPEDDVYGFSELWAQVCAFGSLITMCLALGSSLFLTWNDEQQTKSVFRYTLFVTYLELLLLSAACVVLIGLTLNEVPSFAVSLSGWSVYGQGIAALLLFAVAAFGMTSTARTVTYLEWMLPLLSILVAVCAAFNLPLAETSRLSGLFPHSDDYGVLRVRGAAYCTYLVLAAALGLVAQLFAALSTAALFTRPKGFAKVDDEF